MPRLLFLLTSFTGGYFYTSKRERKRERELAFYDLTPRRVSAGRNCRVYDRLTGHHVNAEQDTVGNGSLQSGSFARLSSNLADLVRRIVHWPLNLPQSRCPLGLVEIIDERRATVIFSLLVRPSIRLCYAAKFTAFAPEIETPPPSCLSHDPLAAALFTLVDQTVLTVRTALSRVKLLFLLNAAFNLLRFIYI